jgi:hypothetical protein
VKRKDAKAPQNLKRRNSVKRKRIIFYNRPNVNLPSTLKIMRKATVFFFCGEWKDETYFILKSRFERRLLKN